MDYQELFNHMHDEHDLILLESEMQEIINIVNKMQGESVIEMKSLLTMLNNKGGLGYEVHDSIDKILTQTT